MIITSEMYLRNFQPWAGGKATFNRLTTEEIDRLDEIFESEFHTISETELNDIFWFEDEWICELLGIDHEKFWKREA